MIHTRLSKFLFLKTNTLRKLCIKLIFNITQLITQYINNKIKKKKDATEVVSSWHDFSKHGRSRAKLARLQYDIAESCLIVTICACEVVPN